MDFKVGDKVRSSSGDQLMEISKLIDDKTVECTWTEDNKEKKGTFEISTLKKAEGGYGTNYGTDYGNT